MSDLLSRAKEEIKKALIEEYLRRHPNVNEQQMVMLYKDGKLLFSDIASVMAEMKVRKNFEDAVLYSAKMIANLAVQENERWEDCCKSTEHSRLILDCLNSSTFAAIDHFVWREEYNYLKKEERACAKFTIALESTKTKISEYKEKEGSIENKKGKLLLIEYLKYVVEQLKVLYRVLKKEVALGDNFTNRASEYIRVTFAKLENRTKEFKLETRHFNKVFSTLKNERHAKIFQDDVLEFNTQLLAETRKTLENATDELKEHNEQRRKQFHEIWESVAILEKRVKEYEEMVNNPDYDKKEARRMVRYMDSDNEKR